MLGLRVRLCLSEMDYAGSGCAHLSLLFRGGGSYRKINKMTKFGKAFTWR